MSDRPTTTEDEIEITPEMIEAGVAVFWDFFGDRDFPVTYDARPFVREVLERTVPFQARHTEQAIAR